MTVITKPLSQQEKDKKDVTGEKTMEEVALKGERNTTEDVESAVVISPPKSYYLLKDISINHKPV